MRYIDNFADQRHSGACIHCGQYLSCAGTNRDHVPSKTLLDKPYPSNLPTIEVCEGCNISFSKDEDYFSVFLSVVLAGTVEPSGQTNDRARRALERGFALKQRIGAAKKVHIGEDGQETIVWLPEMDRVANVMRKNALGHAYYELGESMAGCESNVSFAPIAIMSQEDRQKFERVLLPNSYPEIGSRMMTRLFEEEQGWSGWINVQSGVYRYAVLYYEPIIVRMVLREYLAVEVEITR